VHTAHGNDATRFVATEVGDVRGRGQRVIRRNVRFETPGSAGPLAGTIRDMVMVAMYIKVKNG
jgi:hypothetical protein